MARKLDKVLVVDVESTCWETEPPDGESSEIIEIGLCVIDIVQAALEDHFNIIVKPIKSHISQFCTQLTGWTQDKVNEGISFSEACNVLRKKYKSYDRVWASYGDYDRKQFERQCRDPESMGRYPFGPTHLNVKSLFALQHKLRKEVGMDRALELLNLDLEGVHHKGIDDAHNIARILMHCLYNRS